MILAAPAEEPAGRHPRTTQEGTLTAFRTISEVADELHIPQHVLRFWETKFPQVKPLKRGGGRRYYRPDDIALLRRISDLLYIQGYTIKGVAAPATRGWRQAVGRYPARHRGGARSRRRGARWPTGADLAAADGSPRILRHRPAGHQCPAGGERPSPDSSATRVGRAGVDPRFARLSVATAGFYCYTAQHRSVAQPGSAPVWGTGGRGFESRRSDQNLPLCQYLVPSVAGHCFRRSSIRKHIGSKLLEIVPIARFGVAAEAGAMVCHLGFRGEPASGLLPTSN